MTLEELSTKLDEQSAKLDEQSAKLDEQSTKLDERFANIDERFAGIDARFANLDAKVDQGFNDSKTRDERLEGLMTFGLEAREVLRDEMHRRMDDTDRKHDQQITLLQDAARHRSRHG